MHELSTTGAAINELGGATKPKLNGKDHELTLFSFSNIETATGYFSM
jgi:hypothetical protein